MPGTIKRNDHQKMVEQRLTAYAAALVRQVMARQQALPAPPPSAARRRSSRP